MNLLNDLTISSSLDSSHALMITDASIKNNITISIMLLQTQVLRVRQVNKSYIGLTQENLIEISLQTSLPYILL